ncbi:MAG: ABC transporter ATP-binding protein, partial [Anaerolineales bacterium]
MTAISSPSEFTIPKLRQTIRTGPVRWILSHALHYWYLGFVMVIGAIGNALLAAAVPILVGRALNVISESPPDTNALGQIAILILITQFVRAILQLGRNFSAELGAQRIERDIRGELYLNLLGKSMTFHSLQPVGDTMARATNDVREVNFMFSPGINLVVGSANFLIAPIIFAPQYHPWLILTPVLFAVTYGLALWQYLHELKPITDDLRNDFGRLNTRLAEAVDGIETVKGMAQENQEVTIFERNARQFRNGYVRQGDVEARFLPLLLMGLAQAGGLFHAFILYRQELLTLGDVVAYFGLLLLFGFPTFVSLFAYSQISLGLAGARRILDLINQETDLDQNVAGHDGLMHGEVEFRNLDFSYGDGDLSLENINVKVSPGQTVAIVGQTGTGKTTMVKLINRTHDVTRGSVLVDGIDVRDWNLEALRRQVSIIEQDIFLFSRSIKENIAF